MMKVFIYHFALRIIYVSFNPKIDFLDINIHKNIRNNKITGFCFDIFSANADKMEKLKADQQALEKSVK